ncbi:hypothetical protein FB451DRAFT_149388 [Mycena latifolia]|nr:hypothetical protein FB451DRAFT_149388 [Mycena latifolia]
MPSMAKPQALSHPMAIAEDLRKFCATTPGMNSYQPIATSAVEVCTAAASVKARKAGRLAAYSVDRTELLISRMVNVPISSDILQSLEIFEQKLGAIRRHIEQMPVRSGKKAMLLVGYKFQRETRRLKAELENHLYALLAMSNTLSPSASRSECVLELVSLTTRAAGAICEAPVLNFLKPLVGIAALICDTAKCVKGNHDAAADLAKHASIVTKCIVDRASAASATGNEEALEALKLALEDIHLYLTFLGKPRRRLAPWVFAYKEKDRFIQLKGALDKALAMFSAAKILSTSEDVRAAAGQISVLVSAVERLDSDVNHTLKVSTLPFNLKVDFESDCQIIHADLVTFPAAAVAPRSPGGCARPDSAETASVPLLASSQLTFFF